MYSYLYDNKFLLWITIIFMFIGMITVTIILYLFFLSIVKRKKRGNFQRNILLMTLKVVNKMSLIKVLTFKNIFIRVIM